MVVGLGMVGIAFIEKMLALDTEGKYFIRTCGEEPTYAYNRVGLTEYFQHRNIEDLYLHDASWYAEQDPDHFAFHIGQQVVSIDGANKTVLTSENNTFAYDILVLATGSVADLPSYVTREQAKTTQGVFVYRSIADLEDIFAFAGKPAVSKATVVGGGLLGLEAAKAVYDMKVPEVSIMIRQEYPLNRQLDAPAGDLVKAKIESLGVKVLSRCSPDSLVIKRDSGREIFAGFNNAGETYPSDMVIFAIGIKPRDDLPAESGIKTSPKGGIVVADDLSTSLPGVYAIGECANWRGNFYGLIAPGIEMADILAFNLTQTSGVGAHAARKMNPPDLSTRLKLMGVDVASFGDYFADVRTPAQPMGPPSTQPGAAAAPGLVTIHPSAKRRYLTNDNGPVKCLTYHDPFGATYKKYIFSSDGRHLIGGMMIGDVGDFTKLVAITKKKALDVPPSQFILGSRTSGDDDGDDLDDDTVICSCHNVTKAAIAASVKDGAQGFGEVKKSTKAGSGCGGCVPLATAIMKTEMKKAGVTIDNRYAHQPDPTDFRLCLHFKMSRMDLLQVVKIKKLRAFRAIMDTVSIDGSQGCEICKPAIASILASTYNEHVMKPEHHALQDTNDKFMANIQRNGTFSVVPRIPGGEVQPDQLVAIGQIAKEYGLYTKITGGQRIDMFGAEKPDLPAIWERLNAVGLESGQAYGKSLRTVKSCVGSTWCRFGVGDSVGLAISLEKRYRGVRAPHKFKGGVSGCVRECAEAQSKDFGLIATDKGWNIFIGGNGGATPRHAILFAQDVPPSKVVRILDRYIMFYIRTADRLVRTAPWVESFEGGIEKLRRILIQDELGICTDLESEMQYLISTYEDEWGKAVRDPGMRHQFRQFVNTPDRVKGIENIEERGQRRAADWPKNFPARKFGASEIVTPRTQWTWVAGLATAVDLQPTDAATTSAAVKYGDTQLAIFHVPRRGYYAMQQMCPHKRAFVLDHGIVGDDTKGNLHVSCPLHKRNFRLDTGECTNDDDYNVMSFDVREVAGGALEVLLPPMPELDAVLGTSKWMVRQSTAEALGPIAAANIKTVPPVLQTNACSSNHGGCGDSKLDW
ncbi:Nitrite reductase [NAD(P)H] [Vanrija pseudolonga]|uniref:Nitrite reductase [NAD(P)H] n=1 Tax=Vanrija pseudolonga TaxID=143232 RepID=A0AAF0Y7U4_9TREE|nr:Nitrite reductase [NAD(P)H] [Vanrija pseudolonga]